MTILYLMIPVAIIMGVIALAAFLWSVKNDQYEDLAGAAERVLNDIEEPLPLSGRTGPAMPGAGRRGA
jgi:cbb3-type cytochrome oxidase maturation protein